MRFALAILVLSVIGSSALAEQPSWRFCLSAFDCFCAPFRTVNSDACRNFDRNTAKLTEEYKSMRDAHARQQRENANQTTRYHTYVLAGGGGTARDKGTAVHYAYKKTEVLVVHGLYDTGSVAVCKTVTMACRTIRAALTNLASRELPVGATGWRAEIWGTADVAGDPNPKTYVGETFAKRCQSENLAGNDCLAYARAIDIEAEFAKIPQNWAHDSQNCHS